MFAILLANDPDIEYPDPEPIEVPPGYNVPLTIDEKIALQVRLATETAAAAEGYEDFSEFNDFSLPDDEGDWFSGYELTPMQEEYTMAYESQQNGEGDGHETEVQEESSERGREHGSIRRDDADAGESREAKDADGGGAEVAT